MNVEEIVRPCPALLPCPTALPYCPALLPQQELMVGVGCVVSTCKISGLPQIDLWRIDSVKPHRGHFLKTAVARRCNTMRSVA